MPRARRDAQAGSGGQPAQVRPAGSAPPQRSANNAPSWQFGQFEQHTRGIGAKLLQQMGYQDGQGLGQARHGIVEPLKAHKMQKLQGLGA